MAIKKIIGWGEGTAKGDGFQYDDVVQNSASLSVEEGEEQEAQIEGGKAEGRKQEPDKYILEFDRRIGSVNEVNLGFVENAGNAMFIPKNKGAMYAHLKGCSCKTTLKQDSTDGLVAHYLYKTKGSTDSTGKLDDIEIKASSSEVTYTAVETTTGKNPYEEGWFIKNGDVYIHSFDIEPQDGTTYYAMK